MNEFQFCLLLRRSSEANVGEVDHAMREESLDLTHAGHTSKAWMALSPEVMESTSQGGSGSALPAIDAILVIQPANDSSLDAMLAQLSAWISKRRCLFNPLRSRVLAGTEHIIMPGYGPVALFCTLRRVDTLSLQQFQRYWFDVHAEFGRRPGNRYRQFHTDQAATERAAQRTGIAAGDFDGVAVAYFDDVAQLRATLASPEIARDAYADEQRFIAHSRSQFLPFIAIAGH